MCRSTTCRSCGKTTWAGCGQHIAAVQRTVPRAEWCSGDHGSDAPGGAKTTDGAPSAARGRAGGAGIFARVFGASRGRD